jgi:hypothetical protein
LAVEVHSFFSYNLFFIEVLRVQGAVFSSDEKLGVKSLKANSVDQKGFVYKVN